MYEQMMDYTTQGVFDIDVKTLNVTISKKWIRMLGFDKQCHLQYQGYFIHLQCFTVILLFHFVIFHISLHNLI